MNSNIIIFDGYIFQYGFFGLLPPSYNRIFGRKRMAVDLNFPTSSEGGNRPKKVPKRKRNVKFTTDPTG